MCWGNLGGIRPVGELDGQTPSAGSSVSLPHGCCSGACPSQRPPPSRPRPPVRCVGSSRRSSRPSTAWRNAASTQSPATTPSEPPIDGFAGGWAVPGRPSSRCRPLGREPLVGPDRGRHQPTPTTRWSRWASGGPTARRAGRSPNSRRPRRSDGGGSTGRGSPAGWLVAVRLRPGPDLGASVRSRTHPTHPPTSHHVIKEAVPAMFRRDERPVRLGRGRM